MSVYSLSLGSAEDSSVGSMMDTLPLITVTKMGLKRSDATSTAETSVRKELIQKSQPNLLPNYIRLRPDLRPVVSDEDFVTWGSKKAPRISTSSYTGSLDPSSTISKDIEEKLQILSGKQRVQRMQTLRSFKRGTSPEKFKDYVQKLVSEDEERQRNSWEAMDDKIENHKEIMEDILSIGDSVNSQGQYGFMGSMLEDAENDILDKTSVKLSQGLLKVTVSITRESESLSVTKVVSPANSNGECESLSVTRVGSPANSQNRSQVSSRESEIQPPHVKENSNLSLYKVMNPAANTAQVAGAENQPVNPLYSPDEKLRQELKSRQFKDDSLVVAETTLMSMGFPFRPDTEEFFDDRPRLPSSPFDSNKDRVKQLIEQSVEDRKAKTHSSRKTPHPNSPSNDRIAVATTPIQELKCSCCPRPSMLWCPECSTSFCPICWVKVAHHEFITIPDVWKGLDVQNTANFSTSPKLNAKYASRTVLAGKNPVIKMNAARTVYTEQETDNDDEKSRELYTPSVYLDASGKIRRHSKPNEVLDGIIDDDDSVEEQLHTFETIVNLQSHNNTTLLAAMALQSHVHAFEKRAAYEELNKMLGPSVVPSLAGVLPPVKLNKLDDRLLDRMKHLKNYKMKTNPPKKYPLRGSKSEANLTLPFTDNIDNIQFTENITEYDDIQLPDTTATEIPPMGIQLQDSISTNSNVVVPKDTKRTFSKSISALGYTGWRGIGLQATYQKPKHAEAIVGITNDLTIPLPEGKDLRFLSSFGGTTVYTVMPKPTSDENDSASLVGAESNDLNKKNELKRARAKKKKEIMALKNSAADVVLDKRSPNPLLLETFGAKITERQELSSQQLLRVQVPTYESVAPPLQVINTNLKRAKDKLLREVENTKALLAATAP